MCNLGNRRRVLVVDGEIKDLVSHTSNAVSTAVFIDNLKLKPEEKTTNSVSRIGACAATSAPRRELQK